MLPDILTKGAVVEIAKLHGILLNSHVKKEHLHAYLTDHLCPVCSQYLTVFKTDQPIKTGFYTPSYVQYPPEPLSQALVDRVITDFCGAISPANIEEAGCAVCGELHLLTDMQP
ncbi:hypothetical protein BDN72DRAFT_782105, partial [Pluteus cervinus]